MLPCAFPKRDVPCTPNLGRFIFSSQLPLSPLPSPRHYQYRRTMAVGETTTLNASERKTLAAFHSSWPLRTLPDVIKPYAELIRIHRPAGIMMFYFPCLYGTFLVGCLGHDISLSDMGTANAKLFLLSFLLRGMLCTWNDVIDQDIDRQVARTRIRPLARRAISTTQALVWTLIQCVLILGVFLLLPQDCFVYALPFLGLHILYPFAKRVTHHPQLMLGFAHSLGVFVSFPALGQSIALGRGPWSANATGALSLSAAIIFWTLLNDTIYAAQDVDDDSKAGVGSTMIYWGDAARMFLRVLVLFQLLSLVAVFFVIKDTAPSGGVFYTSLTCGGTALGLVTMVERVDLREPASCAWWFNQGNVLVGYGIGSGLVGEYFLGLLQ